LPELPAKGSIRSALIVIIASGYLLLTACAGVGGGSGNAMPTQSSSVAQSDSTVPEEPTSGLADVETSGPTVVSASPDLTDDHSLVIAEPPVEPRPITQGEQILTMPGPGAIPQTLDPALIRDASASFIARQVFRGLVQLNDALDVTPAIAERVEASRDGMTYTFTLRANAVFHDGSSIDASAVKASFERATDPDLADGDGFSLSSAIYMNDIVGVEERLAGNAGDISGIEVVNDTTVVMRLTQPSANFLYKLTGTAAQVVDVRTTTVDGWWMNPNGSGPFELSEIEDDVLTLTSFGEFYAGEPPLEEVRMLLGSAAASPLNLYEAGEVDLTDVPFYAVDRVLSESDPLNADLVMVEQLSTSFVLLNPNLEPFDDIELRRAIALGFDREKVARVMLDGKVRVADGILPPGMLGREWPATYPPYDVDAAAAIIERIGQPETEPAFYDSGVAVALKQVLEQNLGLQTEAISLEWPEFSSRLTQQSMPAFNLSWIADFPDPANFMNSMFYSQSPDNYIGYHNAEMDRLLQTAETEPDENERVSLYLAAQQLAIDDAVLIPLYHDVSYTVIKPSVNGVVVSPIGLLSLERAWIER